MSRTRPTDATWRIVIVDDHPVVRTGLAALIDGEPDLEVCGQAADLDESLVVIEREAPDLVLVDLSLGGSSGLDLVKEMASREVTSMVVSIHNSPTWAARALAAGARGYVHKSEAGWNIVKAIRKVREGGIYVTETIADALLERQAETGAPADTIEQRIASLTDRELEVFSRIGKGLTSKQIAAELRVSSKTIQTYRERVKRKLSLDTSAELSSQATIWIREHAKEE